MLYDVTSTWFEGRCCPLARHGDSRDAKRGPAALHKAATLRTLHGAPVHSFRTLLDGLATIAENRVQPKRGQAQPFDVIVRLTPLQQQALDRLGLRL